MGRIPDGWLELSMVGKPIEGTRFLAFKVPLKETVCRNLSPEDQFSPSKLLNDVPDLSLIIDLTNTNRYYDKNEFTEKGVQHVKILCPGKVVPSPNLMLQFFHAVDKFMKSANAEDKFIGVHCTHGINRTGYFICNYMVHKMGFNPNTAIDAFQKARGHNIIRKYLIDDLIKNSGIPLEQRVNNKKFPVSNKKYKRKWGDRTEINSHYNDNYPSHSRKSTDEYSTPEGYFSNDIDISSPNNIRAPNSFIKNTQSDSWCDPANRSSEPIQRYNNFHRRDNMPRSHYPVNQNWRQNSVEQRSQLNYYDDEDQNPNGRSYNNTYNSRYNWRRGNNF